MKQQPSCDDKSLLMAYLYDECDADERRLVEQHLAGCATCAAELEDLRAVRGVLSAWTPPDQALGFRIVREQAAVVRPSRWWRPRLTAVPAWAQAAAAVLLLTAGIGVGALGLRHEGTSSADLAKLEQLIEQQGRQISEQAKQISDLRARPTVVATPAATVPAAAYVSLSPEDQTRLSHQIQQTVNTMGQRQEQAFQQQIAERFLRLARDVDTNRIADNRRFLQGLSEMDQRTSQMSQVQNNLVRFVTNVQQMK